MTSIEYTTMAEQGKRKKTTANCPFTHHTTPTTSLFDTTDGGLHCLTHFQHHTHFWVKFQQPTAHFQHHIPIYMTHCLFTPRTNHLPHTPIYTIYKSPPFTRDFFYFSDDSYPLYGFLYDNNGLCHHQWVTTTCWCIILFIQQWCW